VPGQDVGGSRSRRTSLRRNGQTATRTAARPSEPVAPRSSAHSPLSTEVGPRALVGVRTGRDRPPSGVQSAAAERLGHLSAMPDGPKKVVDQVSIQLLTKYDDACNNGYSGYFWIAREKLAPLGLSTEHTCSSNCGTFTLVKGAQDFVLDQVNHADGNDACNKCSTPGCGLAYIQLRMGGRLPGELRPGDELMAYWCPDGETCEPAPLGLLHHKAGLSSLVLVALFALYVLGGVAYGRSKGLREPSGTAAWGVLSSHPHCQHWRRLAGLVQDGVAFTFGRASWRAAVSPRHGKSQKASTRRVPLPGPLPSVVWLPLRH
jgi:hypothetical protein